MDEYLGEITHTHLSRARISQIHIFIISYFGSCCELIDTVALKIKSFFDRCLESAGFREYYFGVNKIVVYEYFSFIRYILREYPKLFTLAIGVYERYKCMIARVQDVSPKILYELHMNDSMSTYKFGMDVEDSARFLEDAGFELGEIGTPGDSKKCYIHRRI